MAVTINLYPPVVDTVMPAFLIGSAAAQENICRVYFSLSLYNKLEQIANAQVTVRNQATNQSALDSDKYPSEIKLCPIYEDNGRETDDKYYIEILPSDMEGGSFSIDQYYKVQIRFTLAGTPDIPSYDTPQVIDAWLSNNLMNFSEWSTVCLVRGISTPTLYLNDFDAGITEIPASIANTKIVGRITFADENENETLNYYRIQLYDRLDNLLLDSGNIYTNGYADPNSISYALNYSLEIESTYYFRLTYVTTNLYENAEEYSFTVIESGAELPEAEIAATPNPEDGYIKIDIQSPEEFTEFTGSLIIRRASDKNNFTTWDDMYVQTFEQVASVKFFWKDYSVESGVLYNYAVQAYDSNGARSPMKKLDEPIMVVFEDIFLTSGDKQIKVEFNPSLSSFKHNISEVKIDTIGSKYPFVKRNGYVDYINFPLGGLVSSAMDGAGIFTNKELVYGDNKIYYDKWNEEHDIPIWGDVIWEKRFRDKVMTFLQEDNVKLFRSPTEGNILIRLMNVNWQPNQTLGRRLWSFTSDAYEMDDCTLENLYKYGVLIDRGDPIYGTGGDDPETLVPIKRLVFIENEEDFPEQGMSQVLYVFDDQFYMWDEEQGIYYIISIPYWNTVDDPDIVKRTLGKGYALYASKLELYAWDKNTKKFRKLSEIQEFTEV